MGRRWDISFCQRQQGIFGCLLWKRILNPFAYRPCIFILHLFCLRGNLGLAGLFFMKWKKPKKHSEYDWLTMLSANHFFRIRIITEIESDWSVLINFEVHMSILIVSFLGYWTMVTSTLTSMPGRERSDLLPRTTILGPANSLVWLPNLAPGSFEPSTTSRVIIRRCMP